MGARREDVRGVEEISEEGGVAGRCVREGELGVCGSEYGDWVWEARGDGEGEAVGVVGVCGFNG